MRRLVYIGQTPAEGTGSPVIVLRHLRRLAAHGWAVTIIGEHGQNDADCRAEGWTLHTLPLRRPWWPPFRANRPVLRRLRTWLLARECARLAPGGSDDPIFGYLAAHADFFPEIAAHLARISGRPLSLLVHDEAGAFAPAAERPVLARRHNWILRQTHRSWFVSPELAEAYAERGSRPGVLLPIPEGWAKPAEWTPSRSAHPKIYYAGYIWPAQYALLAKLAAAIHQRGGRLVLLCRETPELRNFIAQNPAGHQPPFALNREALAHLVQDAAGLVVSYAETIAEMPWIATSYPSKFIEYAHLGLPCSIVAPTESSIGRWAARERYPWFFAPDQLGPFAGWIAQLKTQPGWTSVAEVSRSFAKGPFSPEAIQQQLEDGLIR